MKNKTIDGYMLKTGDLAWEIGVDKKGVYRPTLGFLNRPSNPILNTDRCWKSFNDCNKECDNQNQQR